MNLRGVYLAATVFLSLALLFEWNSEKKAESVERHLESASSSSMTPENGFVSIESDDMSVGYFDIKWLYSRIKVQEL
jgi:hypothetical protein